jgi:LysM repeat protein
MIYLNGTALKGANWSAVWAGDYGFWLAWYAVSTPTNGYQNYDGADIDTITPPFPCAMWQFASHGRLPGYGGDLDVNVFYGDGAAWDAYCRKSGAPAPAPAPAPKPVPKPVPKPTPAPAARTYRVVAGDSLSGIGTKLRMRWQDIAAVNHIGAPYTIYPGQILSLPGAPAPAPAPSRPTGLPPYCTVEAGDTLSGIAAQFGVSLNYIISRNPGINANLIFPGQRINL